MGPFLFLISINLVNAINWFSMRLFADGFSSTATSEHLDTLFQQINSELPAIYDWLCSSKLILNLSKGPVIRAKFLFNLSRNIVALQVETLCCAYYRVRDNLVSQQNLPNPARMIGQSCVNEDGGCSTLSLSEESACSSLFGPFAR